MKHLLSALASRKVSVNVDESDLRALLSRAHKFHGDSKGGETWEETLEKVLVELRTSEYATAFLKPVKKSEAWDYDRVIKHPMDLQTMGKKIRSHSYLSKKAFADDLTLIWDNCLTYNTDPAHPLRRAAQFMRKKSDHILRRIPDRHERFAPSMIERFKFTPTPSALSTVQPSKGALTNGVVPSEKPGIKKSESMMDVVTTPNISPAKSTAALVNGISTAPSRPGTPTPKTSIQAGGLDIPFEDRPALERTPEGMAYFVSLDAQMEQLLGGQDTQAVGAIGTVGAIAATRTPDTTSLILAPGRSRSSSNNFMMNGASVLPPDVNEQLKQLGDEDDELAVWKLVVEDVPEEKKEDADSKAESKSQAASSRQSKSPELVDSDSKKRKRADDNKGPRKRPRLEKLPEPVRSPLENWWHAMGATSLLSNAIPASISSPVTPNPRYARYQPSPQGDQSLSQAVVPHRLSAQKRRKLALKAAKEKPTLHRLMTDNIRARKRARELAIRISDQIEEEKQGVDPDDLAPLIPPELTLLDQKPKTWSQRAGLLKRRRQEFLENDIGPAQAQDCMETIAMTVLEHSNFDSSSSAALQVLGDLAGRCLQNLGQTLKILHETHNGKMPQEEMVLHALFSNSIGTIHELEAYVKGDIIKHGVTLSNMLNTLEEVALKKDEPMDEDAMLNDDGEIMSGLGLLGEDVYGFREMGLDTEFGMKGLDVPRRLLRPKAKADAKPGAAKEVDKYPTPPTFAPLETKRIDDQIGLLRPYYHQRVAALARAPRIPTPPPPPVVPPPPPVPEPVVVVKAKSPTPESPSTPIKARTPTPPPPAPIFDPYNPSALSIFVPKSASSSTPAPAASATAAAAPTPAPAATTPVPPNVPIMPTMPHIPGVPGMPGMIDPATGLPMGIFPPHVAGIAPIPGMIPGMQGMVPGMVPMPMTLPMQPMLEFPEILEDDLPDPSRVKVGPLGQIQVPSAATVAKQKRQHKAAAQAKAAAAAASAANANNPNPNATGTPVPGNAVAHSASVPPGTPTRASVPLQSPVSSTQPKKVTPKKSKKVEPVQA